MNLPPYAHSHPVYMDDPSKWEPLYTPILIGKLDGDNRSDVCLGFPDCPHCREMVPDHGHLNKVAYWTAKFAHSMFPRESSDAVTMIGYLAGLWHDLGKFAQEWQEYLASKADAHIGESTGKIDHSTAGAQHAVRQVPVFGHILAYAIAGHHSGLLDAISDGSCLEKRLKKIICSYATAPNELLDKTIQSIPEILTRNLTGESWSSFSRMLFSCLVDADFLATESFINPAQFRLRNGLGSISTLVDMKCLLEQRISAFGDPKTQVTRLRKEILDECLAAAPLPPGHFDLQVPTGGGKTLSSLAFSLDHAIRHGQRRIIYVVPFTSIIEQNAEVFSEIFAPLAEISPFPIVLEHHSNLSPERETTESRLASENWEAPLVVTTAVQFYESLFAARTSSCRKLHNIANAVIILDEAQCIPVQYLKPCLSILDELVKHYSTSIVYCTATQPAIHYRERFPIGLKNIRPIIKNPDELYKDLKRVAVMDRGKMADQQLANELDQLEQVLVVVNTRRHARQLFQLISKRESGDFHLSTFMCPVHRREVLQGVRRLLNEGRPVRLISTQVVEAGVDIDFPVVYRSLAGVDSIAQAAGRCNRNGLLESGTIHVFYSEHQDKEIYFRETSQIAEQILALFEDPLSPEAVRKYFQLYYAIHSDPASPKWDSKDISSCFSLCRKNASLPLCFQFKTAADRFRLIENEQVSIIVPYDDDGAKLVGQLRNRVIPLSRHFFRSLQRYTVQVYESEFRKSEKEFESVRDNQFHILISPELFYSQSYGLNFDETKDRTALII